MCNLVGPSLKQNKPKVHCLSWKQSYIKLKKPMLCELLQTIPLKLDISMEAFGSTLFSEVQRPACFPPFLHAYSLCLPSGWLRSGSPMEKPLSYQRRAVLSWWRRRSCRWWTVPAVAYRGGISSPSCLASGSASLSGSGATWVLPLLAWWMTTLSSKATKKCLW